MLNSLFLDRLHVLNLANTTLPNSLNAHMVSVINIAERVTNNKRTRYITGAAIGHSFLTDAATIEETA